MRDRTARGRVVTRILRLSLGNPGDSKRLSGGLTELRISYGPGYRVYYISRGVVFVVLLCGGDKSSQVDDIRRAKEIAANIREEDLEPWQSS